MISDPSASAVPGFPLTATAEPCRMRVIWSPGLAPVSHASSIDPFPSSVPATLVELATTAGAADTLAELGARQKKERTRAAAKDAPIRLVPSTFFPCPRSALRPAYRQAFKLASG